MRPSPPPGNRSGSGRSTTRDRSSASWRTAGSKASSPTGQTWRWGSGRPDRDVLLAAERSLVRGPVEDEGRVGIRHAEADVDRPECLPSAEVVARERLASGGVGDREERRPASMSCRSSGATCVESDEFWYFTVIRTT